LSSEDIKQETESTFPGGKIAKKQSERVRFCSALKLQCHIVKNTFLQTAFSAILPTGFCSTSI